MSSSSTSSGVGSRSRRTWPSATARLGFWKAIEEVFPGTRHQRCWVHKTANVLNKVALSVQVNMKADLREILRRADTRGGRGRDRRVRRQIRRQVRQGGHLPDEGSRGPARLLRFSRRALGSPAHIEPDRERVRHGASSNRADKRIAVAQDRQAHGVQARLRGRKNMAAPEGRKPVAQGRPRRQIPKRRRGHRNAGSQRRLIDFVTQNPA